MPLSFLTLFLYDKNNPGMRNGCVSEILGSSKTNAQSLEARESDITIARGITQKEKEVRPRANPV